MKYSNELKVGLSIILAAIVFILGIRFFEDLPLFETTYTLETEFDNAAGLIAGNVVRVNGVGVGSIDDVYINPESNRVRVRFHVDRSVPVREGSRTVVSGFDALGVVRMDVELGPPDGTPIPSGGFVPSREQSDLLGTLSARAPVLAERLDVALADLSVLLQTTRGMMEDPEGDARQTLSAMRGSVESLDAILRSERDRIASVLAEVDGIAAGLNRAMGPNGDSLAATVFSLNAMMVRLDGTLATLEATATGVNTLLDKVNRGEGTIGLLVNDPGIYHRTDSLLASLDALLVDFRANPGRYLKEMRIVDLF